MQDAVYNGDAKGTSYADTAGECQSICEYLAFCDFWTWEPKDSRKILFPNTSWNCYLYQTGWKGWKESESLFQSARVATAISGPKVC